jgi:SAM-dependent methyltransferase
MRPRGEMKFLNLLPNSFKNLRHRIVEEWAKGRDDPFRFLRLLSKRYVRIFLRSFRGLPSGWHPIDDGRFKKRSYKTYELYLKHQAAKPGKVQFTDHDGHIRASLRSAVTADGFLQPGMSVLCLGARFGGEVRAFLDLGCFAVGLDVRTSPNNKYVVYGDFQDVQFPDACVDAVYSNALDHAFDPDRVIGEMKRVLKPGGSLLLDVAKGEEEGHPPGLFESFYWRTADDLIGLLAAKDLRLIRRQPCDYPRQFDHLLLRRTGAYEPVRSQAGSETIVLDETVYELDPGSHG